MPQRKNKSREFFWAKQSETKTPEDHWDKLMELECKLEDFSTELLIKIYNVTYRQEITGQTFERKRFGRTENSQTKTTEYIG